MLYTTQKTVDIQILIIDNNHNFTSIFAKLLKIQGFSVIVKTTFKTGLQYLKHNSCHVVFVDIPLPDYDEKQILNLLNENAIFKKSMVFLFSSIDLNTAELGDWKKCGLYMYLKKPVKRDVLLKALNDVHTQINSLASQTLYDFTEPYEEEATPEQLEKLNYLQKQIEKLESYPAPIAESKTPSTNASLSKNYTEEIPQKLDLVPEPITEPYEEEATPEQLEKLNYLQKQIEKLESYPAPIAESKTPSTNASLSKNYTEEIPQKTRSCARTHY